MTLPILVEQGFRLFCKMYPSDKYAQGIDIDFTDELNDPSVPAVYILSNSKEEILKIGQSSHIHNRFNRMYKCVVNTTNNRIRAHVRDKEQIYAYVLPMERLVSVFENKHSSWELSTSYAPSLEKLLLKEYKKSYGTVPLLNCGVM